MGKFFFNTHTYMSADSQRWVQMHGLKKLILQVQSMSIQASVVYKKKLFFCRFVNFRTLLKIIIEHFFDFFAQKVSNAQKSWTISEISAKIHVFRKTCWCDFKGRKQKNNNHLPFYYTKRNVTLHNWIFLKEASKKCCSGSRETALN